MTVKTWSREVAFSMILGCALLAWNGQSEELEIVIWPVTTFALAAFGMRQPVVSEWMRGRSS